MDRFNYAVEGDFLVHFSTLRYYFFNSDIVNRGEWLWSPANIKRANKDAKIYVGRSTTVHNLLFCVHTPCMRNVTKTFLLVSCSVSSKQLLCFVHGQGQKREQKPRTKNFVEFHNHSPPLTMIPRKKKLETSITLELSSYKIATKSISPKKKGSMKYTPSLSIRLMKGAQV